MKKVGYYQKFPKYWVQTLRDELHKEFPLYPGDFNLQRRTNYLPPVVTESKIGKLAGKLPSKPEGITLWGTIYYTPKYPIVMAKYKDKYGDDEGLVYEFGMYAHETYHAIDQELTGKLKWFTKYVLKSIKTPNAYKHPMEKSAYAFQSYLKKVARDSGS